MNAFIKVNCDVKKTYFVERSKHCTYWAKVSAPASFYKEYKDDKQYENKESDIKKRIWNIFTRVQDEYRNGAR